MKQRKNRKWGSFLLPEGKLREAMELYPGKTREEVRELIRKELVKKLIPGVVAFVTFLVLAAVLAQKEPKQQGMQRPAPGKGSVTKTVLLETGTGWKALALELGALEYEKAQIEELHKAAEQRLEKLVLGENETWTSVRTDLVFPETLPEGGTLYWSTDAPWVIDTKGKVQNARIHICFHEHRLLFSRCSAILYAYSCSPFLVSAGRR